MNICVIPARGGSKRIPRKNIRNFCGKPMITYAIDLAKRSQLFEHIVVSTDDDEISQLAQKNGASVPFDRPSLLSDDSTPTLPVIKHAICEMEQRGIIFKNVCCLYPSVPLISLERIMEASHMSAQNPDAFVMPIIAFSSPIERAFTVEQSGRVSPINNQNIISRTQDCKKTYHDAGQFYWGSATLWKNGDANIHANSIGLEISAWEAVDIDNEHDWLMAEKLYKTRSV